MPLSRHSVGTYPETSSHATCQGAMQPQSSQLAEPLCTDRGRKSGISVRELIFNSKYNNNKKRSRGMIEHSSQILESGEEAPTIFLSIAPSVYYCQLHYQYISVNCATSLLLSVALSVYFCQLRHLFIFSVALLDYFCQLRAINLFLSVAPSVYFCQLPYRGKATRTS